MLSEVEIRDVLQQLTQHQGEYGFEVFAIAKTEPRLRKMAFDEGRVDESGNYKHKIKSMMAEIMKEVYLSPDAEYVSSSHIADNQHKFYIIPQINGYSPFEYFEQSTHAGQFRFNDINDITGIAFEFRNDHTTIWAYQHLWGIMVPNKKKSHAMTRILHIENVDVLAEQKDPLLTIARKIDLLVMDNLIITSNIGLMQSSFNFQEFVRVIAGKTIERIAQNGIAKNPEKLTEYINRKKNIYAKKVMRISNSAVLQLSSSEIIAKIDTVERWRGIFEVENFQIVLNTFSQVENLIDLLDERYTRSDITNKEYDTDVKQLVTSA